VTEVEGADVSVCALVRLDFAVEVWISDVDSVEVITVCEFETITAEESWLADSVKVLVESSEAACEVEAETVSMLRHVLVAIDLTY
jgi:hypothetical protein